MKKLSRTIWVLAIGMLAHLASAEPPSRASTHATNAHSIRVAVYLGSGGRSPGLTNLQNYSAKTPGASSHFVTPAQINAGILTNFDVVVFPGGLGSVQAAALGEDGRKIVTQFVKAGGNYLGVCAGSYLALSSTKLNLHLINARTVSPKWQRGKGLVKIELTEIGKKILGDKPGEFDIRYANGPIITKSDEKDLPEFETLAFFRSELAEHGTPPGVMVGSPAIVCGKCGKGRVICFSPHPEQTKGLEQFISHAVEWLARPEKAE